MMRIGLGCMRLSTEPDRDEALALATLRAALDAGMVVLDTAHAYALDQHEAGHNERLVAQVVRERLAEARAAIRVITKCGMRRDGGLWVPEGRAGRIAEDVEGSVGALGDVPIDLLLLHAPDPRASLATAARALDRARERGLAARVGVSNVSRKQLEEMAKHVAIAAVEVALGAYDDLAIRSGVVAYCLERGIEIFAHAPLGGTKRVGRLARDSVLARIAAARAGAVAGLTEASAIEIFLAYLLAVRAELVPIVGARRPETVASIARASQLVLDEEELALLDARFTSLGALRRPPVRRPAATAAAPGATAPEVIVMMGIQGAGKSRAAERLVTEGYERLNRDLLGGTLRGIAQRLDERLRDGATRIVLDNTYVTRATRNDVLRVAHAHGADVRCIFFDTPLAEAQINVVLRMIDRFGHVLDPAELKARVREDPSALAPHALQRMVRDLEPPTTDEGFASIETITFVREYSATKTRQGLAISLDLGEAELARTIAATPPETACLLFGWRPGIDDAAREGLRAKADALGRETGRLVELALCTHPAGPPICWCRPPLPGLWLAFAHRHTLDLRSSHS